MNKLIKLWKQLTCKHKYSRPYAVEPRTWREVRLFDKEYVRICKKCQKEKKMRTPMLPRKFKRKH